jgi:anthranilate phosphoribosyltransferase
VNGGGVTDGELTPEELGVRRWSAVELAGGDAAKNAAILRDVLGGQKGAPRDAVLANAGAGLKVGGAASSLAEGVRLAQQTIDKGAATAKLEALARLCGPKGKA